MSYPVYESSPLPSPRKQHGCFRLWMGAGIVLGAWAILEFIGIAPILTRRFSPILVYGIVAVLVAELIGIIGVFNFKRWGIYLWLVGLAISFTLRGLMDVLRVTSFTSVGFTLLMLWIFVRPHWDDYD